MRMEDLFIETSLAYVCHFLSEMNCLKKVIFLNLKESSGDKARRMANRELNEMAERLSVDKSIVVS